MPYNPLNIRIQADGVARDKYGREFVLDERAFRRKRKTTVTPAYHAMATKK